MVLLCIILLSWLVCYCFCVVNCYGLVMVNYSLFMGFVFCACCLCIIHILHLF